jgi:Protein of unknown function (DUF4435)/AAA domain, putative AbiEii toxin, Type IV TA system
MQADVNLSKLRSLFLPPSISLPEQGFTEIQATSSIVVVGANGSGKTRFGSWIDLESPQKNLVHRVGAQKSLSIPEYCSTTTIDAAENTLLYGYYQRDLASDQMQQYKIGHRWQSKPSTFLQSDYDKLLTYLFTEEFEKSTKYRQQARATEQQETPPETRLDVIKRIWELVLPHRELIVGAGKIEARSRYGGTSYHSSEMSDGERVIFYLIGQCLAVKKDGIIVIDEPELHLHKALQGRLWDSVEAERPDCLFIYLTHDLDFAVSRVSSKKIWLKSYENNHWDWHLIPESEDIPERLLLEILGSRKPILFVEGDRNSLDFFVFSHMFKDFTVTPCGGAPAVIHSTRSFSNLKHLHSLECKGIIDRDFRSDEQINNLRSLEIFCLTVSEIENLFLSEEVLKAVALSLHREDVDSIIEQAKTLVISHMDREKERLISAVAAARIEDKFSQFNAKALGEIELGNALENMLSEINVTSLYAETSHSINTILTNQDYSAALRLYNNKGLLPQVSGLFGFKAHELTEHIKRLVSSKSNRVIMDAFHSILAELSSLNLNIAVNQPASFP